MAESKWKSQEALRLFLTGEISSGRDPDSSEEFKSALRECTDDELLYRIAEMAPTDRLFSFGDIAAAAIRSEEYRYAVISSRILGRKTLIHNLAVSRELANKIMI